MTLINRIFICTLLTFSAEHVLAQLDTLGILPREDLFVEINRSFFIPGEELRISIVNNGANSFEISRVAYVELVDQYNAPVLQEKLVMTNGKSDGVIYLPSTLKSGQYTLLVYTKWMMNFDLQQIVQRKVNLLNPFTVLPDNLFEKKMTNDSVYVQLFPDGGQFYHESEQIVGYMIKNAQGGLVAGNIQVKDENSNTISDIHSESGHGSFVMTPTKNAIYAVTIVDQMDQIHFTRFETQHSIDRVASFSQNEEFINWSILDVGQHLTMFVWHKSTLVDEFFLDRSEYQLTKNQLPKGLLTFQIKNTQGTTLYERVVFNEPEAIEITAVLDKETFSKREKVTLSLQSELPVDATIFVRKKYPLDIEDNAVLNYFFGERNSLIATNWPGNKVNDQNLLLTNQGVNAGIKSQETVTLPDFRGELIQGVLMDNKKPVAHHHFYVTVVGEGENIFATSTNAQGEFSLSVSQEKSGNRLIFSDIKDYKVEIRSPFLTGYEMVENHQFQVDRNDLERWLVPMAQQVQIKNLYLDQPLPLNKSNILFQKDAPFIYNFDDFHRFPTMSDHIIEYVAQVEMHQSNNQKYFYVRNMKNRSGEYNKVMTTLNGIYYNFEDFLNIDPLKIEKLAINSLQFQLGNESFTGSIELITFPDLYDDKSFNLNANSQAHKMVLESTKYQQVPLKDVPDMRTTLVWEPSYAIGNNGQDYIFNTSDVPGTYEIVISGIHSDKYCYKLIEFEILND